MPRSGSIAVRSPESYTSVTGTSQYGGLDVDSYAQPSETQVNVATRWARAEISSTGIVLKSMKPGPGLRTVGTLAFNQALGNLVVASATKDQLVINSAKATITCFGDGYIRIVPSETITYTYTNNVTAVWDKGTGAHREFADKHGGSLHMNNTGAGSFAGDVYTSGSVLSGEKIAIMATPNRVRELSAVYATGARPHLGIVFQSDENSGTGVNWDAGIALNVTDWSDRDFGFALLWSDFYENDTIPVDTGGGVYAYVFDSAHDTFRNAVVAELRTQNFKILGYINGANMGYADNVATDAYWLGMLADLKAEHSLDGWYLDTSSYIQRKWNATDGWKYEHDKFDEMHDWARALRAQVGNDGIIYDHASGDPWGWDAESSPPPDSGRDFGNNAHFVHCWFDYKLMGELVDISETMLDDDYFHYRVFNSAGAIPNFKVETGAGYLPAGFTGTQWTLEVDKFMAANAGTVRMNVPYSGKANFDNGYWTIYQPLRDAWRAEYE